MRKDKCNSCHADIAWVQTTNGKRMPIDPEPVVGGNLVVRERIGQVPLAFYTKPDPQTPRYVSHFVTCPQRNKWRKTNKPTTP